MLHLRNHSTAGLQLPVLPPATSLWHSLVLLCLPAPVPPPIPLLQVFCSQRIASEPPGTAWVTRRPLPWLLLLLPNVKSAVQQLRCLRRQSDTRALSEQVIAATNSQSGQLSCWSAFCTKLRSATGATLCSCWEATLQLKAARYQPSDGKLQLSA